MLRFESQTWPPAPEETFLTEVGLRAAGDFIKDAQVAIYVADLIKGTGDLDEPTRRAFYTHIVAQPTLARGKSGVSGFEITLAGQLGLDFEEFRGVNYE